MARFSNPQVVTAYDLLSGEVVWLSENHAWTTDISAALVANSADKAAEFLAIGEAQQDKIVGAYLADVTISDGKPAPVHFRETFRTTGPTNYFHGKQTQPIQRAN